MELFIEGDNERPEQGKIRFKFDSKPIKLFTYDRASISFPVCAVVSSYLTLSSKPLLPTNIYENHIEATSNASQETTNTTLDKILDSKNCSCYSTAHRKERDC